MKNIFLLLFTFLVLGQTTFAQKRANLKTANEFYESFEYSKAIEFYRKVLNKSKNNKEAVLKIADAYRQVNNYPKAALWYKKAVELHPKNHEIKYHFAQALMSTGEYDKAKTMLVAYGKAIPSDSRTQRAIEWCDNIDFYLSDSADFKVQLLPMNSRYSDFSPAFFKDALVFASGRPANKNDKSSGWTGESYLDLFTTYQSGTDTWATAKELSGKSQSRFHEGPACFSEDGRKMYLTRNVNNRMKKGKIATLKIYELTNKNGEWSNSVELPFNSKNNKYSIGHPSLSKDGKTLYFTSDMEGGFGGKDLYRSVKNGSEWGTPENLGPKINTEGDEMFPFVHPDGTLYFASTGLGGFGGMDVFFSSKDKSNWTAAQNMGFPVNSPKDDFGLILDEQKRTGYLSSNRSDGKGSDDIYVINIEKEKAAELLVSNSRGNFQNGLEKELEVSLEDVNLSTPQEVKKEKEARLYFVGKVIDYGTLDELEGATIELLDLGSGVILTETTDINGNFYFQVYDGNEYIVFCRNEDGLVESTEEFVPLNGALYEKGKPINVYLKCKKPRELAKSKHNSFMDKYGNRLPLDFQPKTRKVNPEIIVDKDSPIDTFKVIQQKATENEIKTGIPRLEEFPKVEVPKVEVPKVEGINTSTDIISTKKETLKEQFTEDKTPELPVYNNAIVRDESYESSDQNEPAYQELSETEYEKAKDNTYFDIDEKESDHARIDNSRTYANTSKPPVKRVIVENPVTENITYKAQIGAFSKQLPNNHWFLREIQNEYVIELSDSGHFRYLIGNYTDLTSINNYVSYLKSLGYLDAFVTIYLNGERQEQGVDNAPDSWLIYK